MSDLLATKSDMQGNIQIMRDEVAERLDEMADLFSYWQKNRAKGRTPAAVRNAILMAMDEIALLRAAKAITPEVIDQFRKQVSG